jgi:hypothetical protein
MATDTDDAATVPGEQETPVWRVLKRDTYTDDRGVRWIELGMIESKDDPVATNLGEAFGEGDYLVIEQNPSYRFFFLARPISVVADKRWRERTEDES